MKTLAYIAGLAGLALTTALIIHSGYRQVGHALELAGWSLLLLVPFHALPIGTDAFGWRVLLRPVDPKTEAGFGFLCWVAAVRDAVAGLLPVARVGGDLVGIRLLALRDVPGPRAAASVIVEVSLNLISQYLFTLLGLVLVLTETGASPIARNIALGMLVTLPALILMIALLRFGAVFERLGRLLVRITGAGERIARLIGESGTLDHEIREFFNRCRPMLMCTWWQFAALIVGAGEVWIASRLLGHPLGLSQSVLLESLGQTVRLLAFIVPAGIGVQEAGFVVFSQLIGLSPEFGLALSLAKRLREVVFGVPVLISWQWLEGRRLKTLWRSD